MFDTKKSSLIQYDVSKLAQNDLNFQFFIKHDEMIDDLVSGNKWRKLYFNVLHAQEKAYDGILTFGGAYSNHLVATAKACSILGMKSKGIVRGEELNENSNPTLQKCADYGMDLTFVSRSEYANRNDFEYQSCMKNEHNNFYLVPEGGANFNGVIGCQKILLETTNEFDHIFVAAGTATTAAGIALSKNVKSKLHVVSALKGEFIRKEFQNRIYSVIYDEETAREITNETIFHLDVHCGGYGKFNSSLIEAIQNFYQLTGVKLDPIYTGKTWMAVLNAMNDGSILPGEKVLFVHTGGLQGVQGFEKSNGISLF